LQNKISNFISDLVSIKYSYLFKKNCNLYKSQGKVHA
jgi:hypothetical protein